MYIRNQGSPWAAGVVVGVAAGGVGDAEHACFFWKLHCVHLQCNLCLLLLEIALRASANVIYIPNSFTEYAFD